MPRGLSPLALSLEILTFVYACRPSREPHIISREDYHPLRTRRSVHLIASFHCTRRSTCSRIYSGMPHVVLPSCSGTFRAPAIGNVTHGPSADLHTLDKIDLDTLTSACFHWLFLASFWSWSEVFNLYLSNPQLELRFS